MTSKELQDHLHDMVYELFNEYIEAYTAEQLKDVQTFSDAGLMMRNDGLVMKFANGDEFQIAIRRSKRGNG
jgi:hypothetical protein